MVGALALVLFAAGLACTVLGYLRLGRVIASGVLGSVFLALVLRPVVRVITGLVALAFRMWPVRLLRMIEHHRDLLERRTQRVLVWLAFGAWLTRSLDYVGVLGPVRTLGQSLLGAKLERGALSISVEDVLAFVLTLWVAYLLSAFLRFALEEDVYPRVGLARGLSYALSSLLNYVLLALGFLAGLAVLGLDLTKVTILAGAFGVGIGFGLQSVVNNFVSGLILLFERPIHVGDTIEAGGITGSVRRIGIRSSVVRTVPRRRGHRPQCAARHGTGDELDAQRSAAAHRAARGRELQRASEEGHRDAGVGRAGPRPGVAATGAQGVLHGLRRQRDQFRAAGLDGPVRPVVPDPERAGRGRVRCGAGGRDLVSLSPARGASASGALGPRSLWARYPRDQRDEGLAASPTTSAASWRPPRPLLLPALSASSLILGLHPWPMALTGRARRLPTS